MVDAPPDSSLEAFAAWVTGQLQAEGYQALWAGGCVRDRLLGVAPKDYDVATNATPAQVRAVFGRRRTHAVGESFGVMLVLSEGQRHQVEVATFRVEEGYSDGRRPDRVDFASAEEDARRRDFTINGLFYDPVAHRTLDYVGGQEDLQRRCIRAIGVPQDRFQEDKLRLLRAVRFAAALQFEIEAETLAAIRSLRRQLLVVSAERIGDELRRMLVDANRAQALRLLQSSGLLEVLLPEAESVLGAGPGAEQRLLLAEEVLTALHKPEFSTALAAVLRPLVDGATSAEALIQRIYGDWRLTNHERKLTAWLLAQEAVIRQARREPWPRLQRLLISPHIEELMNLARALAEVVDRDTSHIVFCLERLRLPLQQLNPPPLLTGDDLLARHVPRGPLYRQLLEAVRDAQLEGTISTPEEAWDWVRRQLP